MDLGIEENNASFLISVIGFSNLIGRIVLGWISDHHWFNRLYLYSIDIVISGLSE